MITLFCKQKRGIA